MGNSPHSLVPPSQQAAEVREQHCLKLARVRVRMQPADSAVGSQLADALSTAAGSVQSAGSEERCCHQYQARMESSAGLRGLQRTCQHQRICLLWKNVARYLNIIPHKNPDAPIELKDELPTRICSQLTSVLLQTSLKISRSAKSLLQIWSIMRISPTRVHLPKTPSTANLVHKTSRTTPEDPCGKH